MNTASRNEFDRLPKDPVHGFSHPADGCAAPGSACPVAALTSATTANTVSAPTSMTSSTCCRRAETSMPR